MKRFILYLKSISYSARLIYRSSKLWIIPLYLMEIITATIGLLSTYVLKSIFDGLTASTISLNILVLVVIYILVLVLKHALVSIQSILNNIVVQKAVFQYDFELLDKLSSLPLSILDSSEGRDMIDDLNFARFAAVNSIFSISKLFSFFYTFMVAFVVLCNFNLAFSLMFILLTIPGIVMEEYFDRKAEALRLKTAPDARKYGYYRWMLTNEWPAKDVRMYDLTEQIKERYTQEKDNYLQVNKELDKRKLCYSILSEIIRRTGDLLFVAFIIFKALNNQISIGDIALYIAYASTTSDSFKSMTKILVSDFSRTTEIMQRLFNFYLIKTENNEGRRKLNMFESLTFDNVYFKYPHTENYVLSGASFTLNRGDKLSIVGMNGSGKSTIIKLMLGLYEIESGQILINGCPISDYNMKDVRKLFSVLFQSFVQYPLTLRENITLSDLEHIEDDKQIEAVLQKVGLYEDLQPKLVHGLDSYMTHSFDDNGTELSKGQWQKVALARVYFKDSPIIIFDEPSAALDAEAEDKIFKNFEAISEGKTGIMISHRISSARMANKIIVLDGGKISEQGTHDELVSVGGLYAKLYNLQREKYSMVEDDKYE